MKELFSPNSPYARVMLTLFVCIACFLGTAFVSYLLVIPIFDINFFELSQLSSNLSDTKSVEILKFLQLFQSVGLFILSSFIIAWILNEKLLHYTYANLLPKFKIALLAVLLIITVMPAINLLTVLNARLDLPDYFNSLENWMKSTEATAAKVTEAFLITNSISDLLFNILLMAIIPAIGEELLFRGVLLRQLNNWFNNMHWAIIVSAIIFSAIHMQFYGFVPRMVLGIVFGYLVFWSGSLWTAVIAHFINNFMAVMFYYFYNQGKMSKTIDTFGASSDTQIWGLLSMIAATAIVYLIYRNRIFLKE